MYRPSLSAQTATPVPVLTWRYDLTHAGQNTTETLLTPANVNVSSFGKLFSLSVDSTVYAQPLYVPSLKMSDGLMHNVIFVATENDSVYAFDADSNGGANANPIWHINLLTAAHGAGEGATAIPWQDTGSPDVAPTIGITGTPTINPATNTIFVVAATKENGTYFSRLHAINIITGAEQPNSPVNITATVTGTGNGSSGGQLSFSPLWENQRTALNFYNGYVYFGYGAHGDDGPWHGWLFAYNATTLQQTAQLCLTPNGIGAGVWASGAGLPIDTSVSGGRMFIVTGNGTHSTYPPFNANTEFGESVIAFDISNGGLTPTDAFTSFNYQDLNAHDWDLGSGGLLMVPNNNGPNPHILIQSGKEGRIVVLNRDNLGGLAPSNGSSNTNALQDISNVIPAGVGFWSTPAYWNGNVYLWATKNVPMLFKLVDGVMDTEPDSQSSITTAFPDPSFSISSNGTLDGIAWAVRSDQFNTNGPGVLYAWDANDLTSTIYESDTNPQRDAMGPANKFSIPLVTNGKVYVAANGEVDVYGLFNGEPTAAAPVITPNGGTFGTSQNVVLSSATGSASIYYTLDGSTPTPASTLYAGPITIGTDTTLKAIASALDYLQSGVSIATFTFTDQVPQIVVSPAGGTYLDAQTVTLTDADTNAKIYYTTDGSTPSSSSSLYSSPIHVVVSETLKAIAIDHALQNSDIVVATYVIQNGGTSINFPNGFSSTAGLTLNGSAVANNDTRLQLTNGGLWQAGSVFWNAPINIQAFTTTFEFQLSNAQGNGFTFTIQNENVGPTALGGDSAGLGYQGIQQSVAVKFNFYNYQNEGNDSTGVYTNGQPPVLPTVDISPSGIVLGSGDSIVARITYDGTTLTLNLHDLVTDDTFTMSQVINIPATVGAGAAYVGFTGGTGGLSASQKILSWTYSTQSIPPTFTPAPGTYSSAENISLSSATADAAIYYTTNGSTPTAASTQYSKPIPVTASETIKAIAISNTLGSSNIVSGAYVISQSATFSLSAPQTATVAAGASTTSSITITPANGFTGSVAMTCAVSGGPSGAVNPPTCSVTQPAAISGTQAVTSTLTINTQTNTSAGTYTTTVTGVSGTLTETASIATTVTGSTSTPATFSLSAPQTATVTSGASTTANIAITPANGFTGSVALTCAVSGGPSGAMNPPTCSVTQPAAISGTQAVTSTLTIATQATTTAGTYTTTVTGVSGTLTETASIATTVTGFTLSGSSISIASPGASGTSVITVTPSGGFTGSVALACALTSSPQGAVNPPTCSVSQPSAIAGTQAVTATLTVNTSNTATASLRLGRETFALGSCGTIAALLFFCFPSRVRKWRMMISMALFAILVTVMSGCGASTMSNSGGGSNNTSTTEGSYTITVTGTSGPLTKSTTVTVTVQ